MGFFIRQALLIFIQIFCMVSRIFFLIFIVSVQVNMAAQNVGIGTAAPLAKLHLYGSDELLRLQGATPWIGFMNYTDATYRGFIYYPDTSLVIGSRSGSNMRLILAPDNTALLHATADQRIGIGTSAPAEKLDVAGNIRTNGLLKFGGAAPAAFTINLTAGLRYSSTNPLIPDPSTGLYILINHPLCNNDPDALLLVTSVDVVTTTATPQMRVYYEPANGYWFLRQAVGFLTNGQNKWNVLITKNTP